MVVWVDEFIFVCFVCKMILILIFDNWIICVNFVGIEYLKKKFKILKYVIYYNVWIINISVRDFC